MVYRKYIKKNGKFYGPYIYNSRRVNGKVISEYQGTEKKDYKRFALLALGIFILIISVFVFFNSSGKISGNVITGHSIDYTSENVMINNSEIIYPKVYFTLISSQSNQKEISNSTAVNEMVSNSNKNVINSTNLNPKVNSNVNSNVNVTENNSSSSATNESNSSLNSLTQKSTNENQTSAPTNTNTYSDNSTITQTSTPATPAETNSQPNPSQQSSITTSTTSSEPTTPSETTSSSASQPTSSKPATSSTTPETTTTPVSSTTTTPSSEGTSTPITGNIISGILKTVSNFFLGFLKPTGMAVSEQNINGEINGQVSADKPFTYSLNNGETIQLLPGSVKTNSTPLPDDTINIIYQGNNVVISTNYSENIKSNTSELNVTSEPVSFNIEPLNNNEKEILNKEFGNVSIQTIKSELFNGRYIIGYQLGDYNIEYSYDPRLNNETLKSQIDGDKTKWLRDLANKFSNTVSVAQNYSLPA